MTHRAAAIAAVLVGTLALAGCTAGSPSDDGSATPDADTSTPADETTDTALAAALARVPLGDGDFSASFSDMHRAEALGAYDDGASPFRTAGTIGFGPLTSVFLLLEGLVPDGALDDATVTSAGISPDGVIRLDGVPDAEAALAEVTGERSDLDGGTLIVRRDDHEIDFADPDFPPQTLAYLNVIWVDGSTVITGSSRAGVESWVAASGDGAAAGDETGATVASALPGIADCLGDAIGATIVSAEVARTAGDIGIGIAESGGDVVNTLCVGVDDPAAAVDRISSRIADGSDPLSGRVWAELLGDVFVEETAAGWVRVRTHTGTPEIFLSLLSKGTLAALVDG